MQFAKEEVDVLLKAAEMATGGNSERDPDDGSVIIRTKFFNWMDGTYHDTPEPDSAD